MNIWNGDSFAFCSQRPPQHGVIYEHNLDIQILHLLYPLLELFFSITIFIFPPFASKDKSWVSSSQFSSSLKAYHSMTFEVTNDSEKERTQPSSISKDQNPHQHRDHEEMMAGPQTETNRVYEEMGNALICDQDLDLGIKPEEETICQDSAELGQGKDKHHEREVEGGKTASVNSQTDLEITSKEHKDPNEEKHVLKCEEDDQDGEQRNKATERESGLLERSPETYNSQTEASESEAHIHTTEQQKCSALEAGGTSKEVVMHALGGESLPTTDENEQEKRDEVLDLSMFCRERSPSRHPYLRRLPTCVCFPVLGPLAAL